MGESRVQLLSAITSKIPQSFFRDILNDLQAAHREACLDVERKYSQQVAKDLLPHIRRANFEDKLPTTARRHNFNARLALNITRNASHAEIETDLGSTKLVLTTLYTPNRSDLAKVKAAQFRKSHAELQPWLFDELKHIGDGYYGLILYGANAENKENLEFAYLAFPSSDCKDWFARYDLYELAGMASTTENIEDEADPKLRQDIIRKEK